MNGLTARRSHLPPSLISAFSSMVSLGSLEFSVSGCSITRILRHTFRSCFRTGLSCQAEGGGWRLVPLISPCGRFYLSQLAPSSNMGSVAFFTTIHKHNTPTLCQRPIHATKGRVPPIQSSVHSQQFVGIDNTYSDVIRTPQKTKLRLETQDR